MVCTRTASDPAPASSPPSAASSVDQPASILPRAASPDFFFIPPPPVLLHLLSQPSQMIDRRSADSRLAGKWDLSKGMPPSHLKPSIPPRPKSMQLSHSIVRAHPYSPLASSSSPCAGEVFVHAKAGSQISPRRNLPPSPRKPTGSMLSPRVVPTSFGSPRAGSYMVLLLQHFSRCCLFCELSLHRVGPPRRHRSPVQPPVPREYCSPLGTRAASRRPLPVLASPLKYSAVIHQPQH
jgi:hypothetical protein